MNSEDVMRFYYNDDRDGALECCRKLAEENKGNEEILNKAAFLAADFAHPEALNVLFDAGASPAATDGRSCTLLHILALQRQSTNYSWEPLPKPEGAVAAATELLLDRGVSVLRKDADRGMLCYHFAAQNGMAEMIETMAARGIKLSMTDQNGNTGLHMACDQVRYVISRMESKKKDIEASRKKYEETAETLKAVMSEEALANYLKNTMTSPEQAQKRYEAEEQRAEMYFRTVKAFVEGGVDIGEKNEGGSTALDLAVQANAKKIAAYLSGTLTGDDDDSAVSAGGMTLHQAAEKGDAEAIKAIARAGADLNGLKEGSEYELGGCTPLAVAVSYMECDAAEALLACGADPAYKDARGLAAIAYIFSHNFKASLNESIFTEKRIARMYASMSEAGLGVDQTVNDNGDTLLILACKWHNVSKVKDHSIKSDLIPEILKRRPDVNLTNRFGETALMHACARDFKLMENIQIDLLERGADVSVSNRNGDTALHYAARNDENIGAKMLSEMLLEFGADAKAVNNSKKTALDIAVERGNEQLAKLLLSKM